MLLADLFNELALLVMRLILLLFWGLAYVFSGFQWPDPEPGECDYPGHDCSKQ